MRRLATALGVLAMLSSPAAACWQSESGAQIMMGLNDGLDDEEAIIFVAGVPEECEVPVGEEDLVVSDTAWLQSFYCKGKQPELALVREAPNATTMLFRGEAFRPACD